MDTKSFVALMLFPALAVSVCCVTEANAGPSVGVLSFGASAHSCFQVDVPASTGARLIDLKSADDSNLGVASIAASSKLKFTLKAPQSCTALFKTTTGDDPDVLVLKVVVSASFESTTDSDDVQQYSFALDAVNAGEAFIVTSKYLRTEGIAYVRVQAIVVKRSEVQKAFVSDKVPAPAEATLHVLDKTFLDSLGYRATVPFLLRTNRNDQGDPEKYALGVSTSLLIYPMRWFGISDQVIRKLALEGSFGVATGVLSPATSRTFVAAGLGATYDGVVGAGIMWDVTTHDFYGVYANVTLFSEKGLFGLVPVSGSGK